MGKTTTPAADPPDMNVAEFAAYLGVPRETARRIVVVLKRVPHERPTGGKAVLIRGADARKYKESIKVEATTNP